MEHNEKLNHQISEEKSLGKRYEEAILYLEEAEDYEEADGIIGSESNDSEIDTKFEQIKNSAESMGELVTLLEELVVSLKNENEHVSINGVEIKGRQDKEAKIRVGEYNSEFFEALIKQNKREEIEKFFVNNKAKITLTPELIERFGEEQSYIFLALKPKDYENKAIQDKIKEVLAESPFAINYLDYSLLSEEIQKQISDYFLSKPKGYFRNLTNKRFMADLAMNYEPYYTEILELGYENDVEFEKVREKYEGIESATDRFKELSQAESSGYKLNHNDKSDYAIKLEISKAQNAKDLHFLGEIDPNRGNYNEILFELFKKLSNGLKLDLKLANVIYGLDENAIKRLYEDHHNELKFVPYFQKFISTRLKRGDSKIIRQISNSIRESFKAGELIEKAENIKRIYEQNPEALGAFTNELVEKTGIPKEEAEKIIAVITSKMEKQYSAQTGKIEYINLDGKFEEISQILGGDNTKIDQTLKFILSFKAEVVEINQAIVTKRMEEDGIEVDVDVLQSKVKEFKEQTEVKKGETREEHKDRIINAVLDNLGEDASEEEKEVAKELAKLELERLEIEQNKKNLDTYKRELSGEITYYERTIEIAERQEKVEEQLNEKVDSGELEYTETSTGYSVFVEGGAEVPLSIDQLQKLNGNVENIRELSNFYEDLKEVKCLFVWEYLEDLRISYGNIGLDFYNGISEDEGLNFMNHVLSLIGEKSNYNDYDAMLAGLNETNIRLVGAKSGEETESFVGKREYLENKFWKAGIITPNGFMHSKAKEALS